LPKPNLNIHHEPRELSLSFYIRCKPGKTLLVRFTYVLFILHVSFQLKFASLKHRIHSSR